MNGGMKSCVMPCCGYRLFDSYVLGGVDVLYEKLLENGHGE